MTDWKRRAEKAEALHRAADQALHYARATIARMAKSYDEMEAERDEAREQHNRPATKTHTATRKAAVMTDDNTVTLTREQAEALIADLYGEATESGWECEPVLQHIASQLKPKRAEPTPGPWTWCNGGTYVATNRYRVCSVTEAPDGVQAANARLIAAAPEFLAWAQSILYDGDLSGQDETSLRAIVAKVYGGDDDAS